MADIFGRGTFLPRFYTLGDAPQPSATPQDILGERRVAVRIRALGESPTVEILVDGKPMGGFIQRVAFSLDAETMVPSLTVTLVPDEIDLDANVQVVQAMDGPAGPSGPPSVPVEHMLMQEIWTLRQEIAHLREQNLCFTTGGQISQTTGLKAIGLDYRNEVRRMMEEQAYIAEQNAKLQQMMHEQSFRAEQDALMTQRMIEQAQMTQVIDMGSGEDITCTVVLENLPDTEPLGTCDGVLGDGVTRTEILEEAQRIAQRVMSLCLDDRDNAWKVLKKENPTLHALAMAEVRKMREAASGERMEAYKKAASEDYVIPFRVLPTQETGRWKSANTPEPNPPTIAEESPAAISIPFAKLPDSVILISQRGGYELTPTEYSGGEVRMINERFFETVLANEKAVVKQDTITQEDISRAVAAMEEVRDYCLLDKLYPASQPAPYVPVEGVRVTAYKSEKYTFWLTAAEKEEFERSPFSDVAAWLARKNSWTMDELYKNMEVRNPRP